MIQMDPTDRLCMKIDALEEERDQMRRWLDWLTFSVLYNGVVSEGVIAREMYDGDRIAARAASLRGHAIDDEIRAARVSRAKETASEIHTKANDGKLMCWCGKPAEGWVEQGANQHPDCGGHNEPLEPSLGHPSRMLKR